MPKSQWHKLYTATICAPPATLFDLLADLPNYNRWLPDSDAFEATTDVDPYPVQLGSRYHDGKPGDPGKAWWGTVIGFQRPGLLDFNHTIKITPLRATVDVHIHYSLEQDGEGTQLSRWLVLDFTMPPLLRPLRRAVTTRFDEENVRTLAALKQYAEAQPATGRGPKS
jgi:uncharacterized protein YndB with AHSA1/START domain